METTLEKHLATELRASSESLNLGDFDFLSDPKERKREDYGESFFIRYGIIHPIPDTETRLIREFYQNSGYAEVPYTYPEGSNLEFIREMDNLNEKVGAKRYSFLKLNPDSLSSIVILTAPDEDGFLVTILKEEKNLETEVASTRNDPYVC